MLVRPFRIGNEMQQLLMLCETRDGAVTAAIGSTLRRPSVAKSPEQ